MQETHSSLEELSSSSSRFIQLLEENLPQSPTLSLLKDFQKDLMNNKQMITVLGEFKRGKSTLINAILGEELLPSNVLPTTATVQAIHTGSTRAMNVHYINGLNEELPLYSSHLKTLTYDGEIDHASVHHVEIILPNTNLPAHTILVDTPGVGDLNDHQLDVTYSYIPRSDLIVFVIDMTAPLKKSEIQYLIHTVLPLHHGNIIFAANFADRLEEEEYDEVIEFMRKRLKKITQLSELSLFPVSALDALTGDRTEIDELLEEILAKLEDGRASQAKSELFHNRYQSILRAAEEELHNLDQILRSNEKELEEGYQQIDLFMQEWEQKKRTVAAYTNDRKMDMQAILKKSIEFFKMEEAERVREEIEAFHGGNFEQYVEKSLPIAIKRRMEHWMNRNTHSIEVMMKKFEKEMVRGLNKSFNSRSSLVTRMEVLPSHLIERVDLHGEGHSSNAMLTTGIIGGAAAAAFIAMGGFVLLPILSMAGLPFLNKYLSENKLEKAKAHALPEIEKTIEEAIDSLHSGLVKYINQSADKMMKDSLAVFEEKIREQKHELESELLRRKNQNAGMLPTLKAFTDLKEFLQSQTKELAEVSG